MPTKKSSKDGCGRCFARAQPKRSDQLVDRPPKIPLLRVGGKQRIKAAEIPIDQDLVGLGARRNGVDAETLKATFRQQRPDGRQDAFACGVAVAGRPRLATQGHGAVYVTPW